MTVMDRANARRSMNFMADTLATGDIGWTEGKNGGKDEGWKSLDLSMGCVGLLTVGA